MQHKILVIQTAFTGDAILASALMESLHAALPEARLDLLVRKGNENLYSDHPFLNNLIIWDKKNAKWNNLFRLLLSIRKERFDMVINLQRFASTGLLTAFSGAKERIGFKKNPFSFLFNRSVKHEIGDGRHEIERNNDLIAHLSNSASKTPRLYPTEADKKAVIGFMDLPYICLAPGSVWATKMWPEERWAELIQLHLKKYPDHRIFLLGAPSENNLCERLKLASNSNLVTSLSGKLSLLQAAELMRNAQMNYVNDSAPLHLASAMNASVTAIFCSTIPAFGFGPLSKKSKTIEVKNKLECRPCGLHGKKSCPLGHFKCGNEITAEEVIQ